MRLENEVNYVVKIPSPDSVAAESALQLDLVLALLIVVF